MTTFSQGAPRRVEQAWSGGKVALVATVALMLAGLLHVGFGAKFIPPGEALRALVDFDAANWDHVVIRRLRLPRLLVAATIGATLGLAGATIQAVTRNPLADPGILGMNAGAVLAVVLAMTFVGGAAAGAALPWIAAAGAITVFTVVVGIASAGRSGPTPFKVTLAGASLSLFAHAATSGILIFDEQTLETIRLWRAGTLAGRPLQALVYAAPALALGGAMALAASPRLNALALGEMAATGLGVPVRRTRLMCLLATGLLAGGAVSVVGPIAFVGLAVPHAVKLFVPAENRLILPLSMLVGALVLVLADLAGRVLLAPQEIAVGIMVALLGAPVFIALVQSRA